MGACATKPKVLGDKLRRSRRHSSTNSNYNDTTAPSFSSTAKSSLKDEKRSLSFSVAPNKDETIISPKEDEDVGSKTIVANHYAHQDKLPSNDDDDLDNHDHDDVHFGESTKDHETDHIVSAVTKAIEEDENVVVEEPAFKKEASGLTPTHELQDHIPNKSSTEAINPAGLHPQNSPPRHTSQNDVVETENPAGTLEGQNDVAETTNLVGVLVRDPDSPPPTEKDIVETISLSDGAPRKNDVVEAVSPAGVVQLQISPPPSYTSKNVVVESTLKPDGMETLISSATTSHHSSKDLLVVDQNLVVDPAQLHGPIKTHSLVVYDHVPLVNKLEARNNEGGDVIATNAMPSTFAF